MMKEVDIKYETDGYHLEEFNNPLGSDVEEEYVKKTFPQFNRNNGFSEVKLEVGMEFSSLAEFKSALREYSIFLGREFKWKKNDKVRAKAIYKKIACDWEIYYAKNDLKI